MKDMSDRYRITVNLNLRPAAVALLEDLAKARRQTKADVATQAFNLFAATVGKVRMEPEVEE